jgi:DnaA family protein
MMRQLPLGVRLPDTAVFSTFYPGPNDRAVAYLQELGRGRADAGAWLWGSRGVGKTHLLQAVCRAAGEAGVPAVYLPLAQLAEHGAAPFVGLGGQGLVAVDDLDRAAGRDALERALFRLYNDLQEAGGKLLVASRAPPAELPIELADLRSRLGAGVVYQLRRLDDAECVEALRMRAAGRGLELPADTARFLMRRLPRDIGALCGWLDRLDRASLAAQRRLTVPFVRDVLGRDPV